MAGALDTLFKDAAKKVVADLGSSLDIKVTYKRKRSTTYRISTGEQHVTDTSYTDINVPIEYIHSEEENADETREAKLYITPDLIGGNQPTFEDEIVVPYAGGTKTAQIIDIRTLRGGQTYLFIVLVQF